jgi:thiol-disulfide isomerase/thioredoxin
LSLILLTREECGLCEAMLQELQSLCAKHPLPAIQLVDVDSDRELQRRYGLKIPVLLWDRVPICSVKLDTEALLRALRAKAGAA